jgi:hypothetical protein
MNRIKLFLEWYKLLRSKGYGAIITLEYARYNSKYYNIDGKNK